jgi:glycosyltransferase involved in cell wall biosynthesis
MQLLYVVDRFPVLSETFVVNEVRGLLRAGDDVTVYVRRGGEPGVADDLRELVIGPGSAVPAGGVGAALALRERGALHALAEAAWLARRVRADHVHAHFAFGAASVALLFGRVTDTPASFTAHAADLYAGVPCPLLGRKVAAARFAAAVSEHGVARLRGCAVPADRGKVVLQRNGVAPGLPPEREDEPRRVVTIARLTAKKGLDVLVRAARVLDRDVVLEVVGDGPERGRLEALARDAGANVRFAGALHHEAALERLRGASAFVLPCRELASGDRDGLPVSLVEAMRAGVPVVTTPVGGIPELVLDGETGLLVAPDDVAALSRALTRLLGDPALRERLAAAGRTATLPWDLERCVTGLRARFS